MANVFWKATVFLVVAGVLCAFFLRQSRPAGPELVARTREALRQQGFDSDPRLQLQVALLQRVADARGGQCQ